MTAEKIGPVRKRQVEGLRDYWARKEQENQKQDNKNTYHVLEKHAMKAVIISPPNDRLIIGLLRNMLNMNAANIVDHFLDIGLWYNLSDW